MAFIISMESKDANAGKRYLSVPYDDSEDICNWTDNDEMAYVFETEEEASEVLKEASGVLTGCLLSVEARRTYDIKFNNGEREASNGWESTFSDCKAYIEEFNGTQESYFEDFKGGVVSIVCNQTSEEIYYEDVI